MVSVLNPTYLEWRHSWTTMQATLSFDVHKSLLIALATSRNDFHTTSTATPTQASSRRSTFQVTFWISRRSRRPRQSQLQLRRRHRRCCVRHITPRAAASSALNYSNGNRSICQTTRVSKHRFIVSFRLFLKDLTPIWRKNMHFGRKVVATAKLGYCTR